MTSALDNYRWAERLIQELIRAGVSHFFIAPGSRSAPLSMVTLRIAQAFPEIQCHHHFDERSLAFAALGAVKANASPVVVLTSSGTAVANLLPAIVEAAQLNLPLIALTADRPESLIHVGANQAIEQPGLFSHFVRQAWNLPIGVETPLANDLIQLLHSDPGPIHINVPFSEPLYPELHEVPPTSPLPEPVRYETTNATKNAETLVGEQCVIVAGALTAQEAEQVIAFAEQYQCLIFPDVTSQLRQRVHPLIVNVVHFMCAYQAEHLHGVTHIIQFGGRLVSKPVNQWLERFDGDYRLVSEDSHSLDPTRKAKQIQCESSLWSQLFEIKMSAQAHFNAKLAEHQAVLIDQLSAAISQHFSEYSCAHGLSQLLPENHLLFLGNSLAIRVYDQVAVARSQSNRVFSNRGASGIDGLIATVAGMQLSTQQPITALMGDLSALYDLNSLYWLKQVKQPCVLVVLNNDGGQIFKMLPAAGQTDVFQQAFEQPHGLCFEDFARGFGIRYDWVSSLAEFDVAYKKATEQACATVLEVSLPRDAFVQHHRYIQAALHD